MSFLLHIRSLIFIIFTVLHTLVCSVIVIIGLQFESLRDLVMRFIKYVWARPILWILGVEVEVRGADRVKQGGSIVLFNHSSLLDIPVIFGYFPKAIYFGAKIELFRIPFFGRAMKSVGVLPIDRSKRAQVLQIYEAAIPRFKQGHSFALAPEGTRQTERRIGGFKRGPFEFACLAEVPLQPIVIAGALDLLPNDTVFANLKAWKSKVIMEVLSPIFTYKEDDPSHLMEVTSSHMAETYANLNEELGLT